jgi:hypothetical protein
MWIPLRPPICFPKLLGKHLVQNTLEHVFMVLDVIMIWLHPSFVHVKSKVNILLFLCCTCYYISFVLPAKC